MSRQGMGTARLVGNATLFSIGLLNTRHLVAQRRAAVVAAQQRSTPSPTLRTALAVQRWGGGSRTDCEFPFCSIPAQ